MRGIGEYVESSILLAGILLAVVRGLVGLFRGIPMGGATTNPENHFLLHSHMRETHRKAVTPFSYCG